MNQHATSHALMFSSGNGPAECQMAVAHAVRRLTQEAGDLGVDLDIDEETSAQGMVSALIVLSGPRASVLHSAWTGTILWVCKSPLRPRHGRKNWFIEVFDASLQPSHIQIDEREIQMQAIRAGGPGGQHQNKTSSAIRAQWVSKAGKTYAVLVRDHRSQHQNRSAAINRLRDLVRHDVQSKQSGRSVDLHKLHHTVSRGAPRRTYKGEAFVPA